MKLTYHGDPFPYVLIEDFFPPEYKNAITKDLHTLSPHLKPPAETGAARDFENRVMKQNKGMFLDPQNQSTLTKITTEQLWDPSNLVQIDCDWFRNCFTVQRQYNILLSRYDDGDMYLPHHDISFFTALIWLYEEPKPFKGGDLIFPDHNVKVECKNNCGVLFLGPTKHQVTQVKGSGRFTITVFTDIKQAK